MSDERCMFPVGKAYTGNLYCGNRCKAHDANGRPICGTHKKGCPGIAWYGDRYRYPEGTAGDWKFARGEFR